MNVRPSVTKNGLMGTELFERRHIPPCRWTMMIQGLCHLREVFVRRSASAIVGLRIKDRQALTFQRHTSSGSTKGIRGFQPLLRVWAASLNQISKSQSQLSSLKLPSWSPHVPMRPLSDKVVRYLIDIRSGSPKLYQGWFHSYLLLCGIYRAFLVHGVVLEVVQRNHQLAVDEAPSRVDPPSIRLRV